MESMNLRTLRINKNFTLKKVAEHLGMSESGYCLYEKGIRTPNAERMLKLSQILNVPVEDIVKCFVK